MTRLPFNIPLVASLVAIAFASIVMAAQLADLVSAVLTPSPRQDPTLARLDDFLTEHADGAETYRGRFDGRSLFFKPKPPPPPPKPPAPVAQGPSKPPPPAPAPKQPGIYPGPSVSFVVGDEVWFHDGVRASVGEEVNGVTIIASEPPWKVTLGYGGWEYDIKLLMETKSLFPDRPKKSGKESFPGIEPVAGTGGSRPGVSSQ